ncbi:MAG: cyclic pyranopterin monophosphate synthase MoaC [Phycisphaerae bacterium]
MQQRSSDPPLSHVGPDGTARMVDISAKPVTPREACASAVVAMKPAVLDALMAGALPKGDALATARVAGIQAAKRTSEWIPLCHPLPIECITLEFRRVDDGRLRIECSAKSSARTGMEMEALTGAAAAALTVYDMAKAADKSMVIGPIRLESKRGGKSGVYTRGRKRSRGPAKT